MKVAIVGGGACGLVLARVLEKNHISYELFEKSLCGRKILASGNGKANIGNTELLPIHYNHPFGYQIVKKYYQRLMDFYREIGLFTKIDEMGRIYPYSESSQTVLNCLNPKGLKIVENFPVERITKMNGKYYLNDVRGPFDYVVLALGSIASFTKKKQEGFYQLLHSLPLQLNAPAPSLVGFRLEGNFKRLSGVRLKCEVSLLQDGEVLHKEAGEVIIKADGISGICIMNLSSVYARLKNKTNCWLSLNLIPGMNLTLTAKQEVNGLVHPKLAEYLLQYSLAEIQKLLLNLSFKILGVYDFEFAQVVSGGIGMDSVTEELRLKEDSHIFAGGEILDVDGLCGGYNLMFAFCSALYIGDILCNIKS